MEKRWDLPNLKQTDAAEAAVVFVRAHLAHLRPSQEDAPAECVRSV
jgi:hypothetical protein